MAFVVVLLGIALIYLFLVAPRMVQKPDRTPFCGVHYAHRGLFDNASDAPENSLSAFRKAVEAGYGIEMDVQLTKDDIPIVFHDATLRRMCGADGNIWDYTLKELQKMKLANSEETIPTFEAVLKAIRGKVPLIIEYKVDKPNTKVCELGDALLAKYPGVYCVESFNPLVARWYRKHRPNVVRGQLSENYWKDKEHRGNILCLFQTYLLSNFLTRPDFIAYRHSDTSNFSRRLCRKLGAMSVAWTIRNQEDYEKAKPEFDLFVFDSFIPRD